MQFSPCAYPSPRSHARPSPRPTRIQIQSEESNDDNDNDDDNDDDDDEEEKATIEHDAEGRVTLYTPCPIIQISPPGPCAATTNCVALRESCLFVRLLGLMITNGVPAG